MKKIGVLVLVLCMVFFSAVATFATDIDKDDVIIGSEKTSASQTNQRDSHTVSTSEELTIDGKDKSIDVALTLKTSRPKTTAVATGDATPVLLLFALMAVSAVAAIILIRRKKLSKAMAALLSVAMLLTGFVSGSGTAQALSFSDSNVAVAFTDDILKAFDFGEIVSVTGGTCTLTDDNGTTVGFEWTLGDLAKSKTQKLVYRMKMKDTVPDSILDNTMNVADTSFEIGKGVPLVKFPKASLKLGLEGFELIYDANGGNSATVPATELKLPGRYTLSTDKPLSTPSNDPSDAPIVFIGWSAAADSKTYSKDDGMPTNLITEVEIVDKGVTVYAVWGYDVNDNGIPDVMDIVSVEKIAVETTYTVGGTVNYTISFELPEDISFIKEIRVEDVYPNTLQWKSLVSAKIGGDIVAIAPNTSVTGKVSFVLTAAQLAGYEGETVELVVKFDVSGTATGTINNTVNIYTTPVGGGEPTEGGPTVTTPIDETTYTLTYDVGSGNDDGPADDTGLTAGNHDLNKRNRHTTTSVSAR